MNPPLRLSDFAHVALVAATVVLVNLAKRLFADARVLSRVPVPLYVLAVSAALTAAVRRAGWVEGGLLSLSGVHAMLAVALYELTRDGWANATRRLCDTFDARYERMCRENGGRGLRLAVAVALAASVLAGTPGCALFNPNAAPLDRYTAAKQLYNTTNKALLALKLKGAISQAAWDEAVLPTMDLASAAFDEVEAKLAAGEKVDFDSALNVINRYLDRLIAEEQKAKAPDGGPGDNRGGGGTTPDGPEVLGRLPAAEPLGVHARAA